MRVLINALSATNLSSRHVLLGHLSKLAEWTDGLHEYIVLYHGKNSDICRDLGSNVHWVECPSYTSQWMPRSLWELLRLPALTAKLEIDFMFMPSGITVDNYPVPQISFAQNPWCLVPGVQKTMGERIKAALQRREYRKAMEKASIMIFNSEYMRQVYRENAGFNEKHSMVVYQGIDEATFAAADELRDKIVRNPLQVVCVSVMARHKGVETVVEAIRLLRKEYGLPATLTLIGEWPDRKYERSIRSQVRDLGLENAVVFLGHVTSQALHRAYAESRVFCLMSRCESFGIPAIEAQAFGTPVVASACCAMPEVEGEGGLYVPPGDAAGAAMRLFSLLSDDALWQQTSESALKNAERYHWEICSRPLLEIFNLIYNFRGATG
jgi:glycosyltransferase involved in cell wall biosynthesis